MFTEVFAVYFSLLSLLFPPPSASTLGSTDTRTPAIKQRGYVTRVVDGDTIVVSINDTRQTIRLIGIDAPESVRPSYPAECFGKASSSYAAGLVDKKDVILFSDNTQKNTDAYGRLLRYVMIQQTEQDLGELMLSEGYAQEYTYNTPYQRKSTYLHAQSQAKKKKKGIWGTEVCK